MKCRSAMEILKIAKVDVDEVFPDIDIPQANLPKRGEPAPKLKIAVKDGEEYYDVTTGKMVSFEGDEDSAIESNDFSAAASSIFADAIVGEDGPDSEPIPDEPEENPELKVVPPPAPVQPEPVAVQPAPEPEPIPEPQPVPAPTPAEDIQSAPVFNTKPMAQRGIPGEINAPIRKRKIFIPGHEGISGSAPASQPVSASVPPVHSLHLLQRLFRQHSLHSRQFQHLCTASLLNSLRRKLRSLRLKSHTRKRTRDLLPLSIQLTRR